LHIYAPHLETFS